MGIFNSQANESSAIVEKIKGIFMKNTDLISLFERSLRDLPEEQLEEVGTVIRVGDNICTVYGLSNAMLGELITFEGGNSGIVFQLNENSSVPIRP